MVGWIGTVVHSVAVYYRPVVTGQQIGGGGRTRMARIGGSVDGLDGTGGMGALGEEHGWLGGADWLTGLFIVYPCMG